MFCLKSVLWEIMENRVRRGPPTYVYVKPATFVYHLFPKMDYWHGAWPEVGTNKNWLFNNTTCSRVKKSTSSVSIVDTLRKSGTYPLPLFLSSNRWKGEVKKYIPPPSTSVHI